MNIKKAIGCGVIAIALFVGLILSVVFYATSGITEAADEFFAAARSGDDAAAYALTSQQLQNQLTSEDLGEFLEQNGLDAVVETSWASRSMENDRGELSGTVTTETGGAIPIEMGFIYEQEQWKISLIDVEAVGLDD